jgi:hypothetical protein
MLSLFLLLITTLCAPGCFSIPLDNGDIRRTLAFTAKINATGFVNLVQADQARAKALRERSLGSHPNNFRRTSSFSINNTVVFFYFSFL